MQEKVRSIHDKLRAYENSGMRMFSTCSFQTHSIALLHILSIAQTPIDIYFINTGFHFPETLQYRDMLSAILGITVHTVSSPVSKSMQRDTNGNLLYASAPDLCCYLNKTQVAENLLREYDVWVNGVRASQSEYRSQMQTEQAASNIAVRYHPMLHWSSKEIYEYLTQNNLPTHPLHLKGYYSIGCEPCTSNANCDTDRSGRWQGLKKTECGLNTDLIKMNI